MVCERHASPATPWRNTCDVVFCVVSWLAWLWSSHAWTIFSAPAFTELARLETAWLTP